MSWCHKVLFALGVMVGLMIAGCEPAGEGRVPIIRNQATYQRVLDEAERLSRGPIERYDQDQELTEAERRDLREARLKFQGLIGFQPEVFALHFGLAKVEQALGEHAVAVPSFQQAVLLAPAVGPEAIRQTVAEAHGQTARSLIFLGEYSAAAEAAKAALDLYPEHPDYLHFLASAAVELGDPSYARELLEEALAIDPNHARSQRLLRFLDTRS